MEIRNSNNFNKIDYFKNFMTKFLQSKNKARHEIVGNLRLLNNAPNTSINAEKKQILERLDKIFSNTAFNELIEKEKKERGIIELTEVSENRRKENLQRISELAQELTTNLSEIIFGDLKRTYDMSKLNSNSMIQTIKNPDGSTRKAIQYRTFSGSPKEITDFLGNTISIRPIGLLTYSCHPFIGGDMYAYRISKHKNGEITMNPQTLFSDINISLLNNPDYRKAVANTLLADNNIKLSHSYGFIGNLDIYAGSKLSDGEEKFFSGFYEYKIPGSKYTLVYEDVKIEAAKAYRDEQEKKIKAKESDDDER